MYFDENFNENELEDLSLANFMTIANKAYILYLNQKIGDLNINMEQIPLIFELDKKDSISKKELAKYLFMNDRNTTKAFMELYHLGIIDKNYIPEENDDKKSHVKLSLTSYGKYIASEIRKIDQEWEELIYNNIESADKEKIIENMKDVAVSSIKTNEDNDIFEKNKSKILKTKAIADRVISRLFDCDIDNDYSNFRKDCFNMFKNHNKDYDCEFGDSFHFRNHSNGRMHRNRRGPF